jgi:hypothetical protein
MPPPTPLTQCTSLHDARDTVAMTSLACRLRADACVARRRRYALCPSVCAASPSALRTRCGHCAALASVRASVLLDGARRVMVRFVVVITRCAGRSDVARATPSIAAMTRDCAWQANVARPRRRKVRRCNRLQWRYSVFGFFDISMRVAHIATLGSWSWVGCVQFARVQFALVLMVELS